MNDASPIDKTGGAPFFSPSQAAYGYRDPSPDQHARAVSSTRRRDGKNSYATLNRNDARAERKSPSSRPIGQGNGEGPISSRAVETGKRDEEAYAIALTCDSMKSISSSDRPYFA